MKRFYKMVTCARGAEGYEIHLDGKKVKTPSGIVLHVPGKALAEAVVQEWARQTDTIAPDGMPLTQLATTACDQVRQERAAMERTVLAYLDTDLLCYRASQPAEVGARQEQLWDPWLSWFEKRYGTRLQTTTGIQALRQSTIAHRTVAEAVKATDDSRFTVLQLLTGIGGSLVLALAFLDAAITPDEFFEAVHVEENYKASIYNEAEHGFAPHIEKKRASIRQDLQASRQFLDLLKTSF